MQLAVGLVVRRVVDRCWTSRVRSSGFSLSHESHGHYSSWVWSANLACNRDRCLPKCRFQAPGPKRLKFWSHGIGPRILRFLKTIFRHFDAEVCETETQKTVNISCFLRLVVVFILFFTKLIPTPQKPHTQNTKETLVLPRIQLVSSMWLHSNAHSQLENEVIVSLLLQDQVLDSRPSFPGPLPSSSWQDC